MKINREIVFKIGKKILFFYMFVMLVGNLSAENSVQFPDGKIENDRGNHWISLNGFKLFIMENERIPSGEWKVITEEPTNVRVEVKSPYKLEIIGSEIKNGKVKLSTKVKKDEEYYFPNKLSVIRVDTGEVIKQCNSSEVELKDGENVKIIVEGIHNQNFNMPLFRREKRYIVFATTSTKGEEPVYEKDFQKYHFQVPSIIEELLFGGRGVDENKINIALVLDVSGSMAGDKIKFCKKAGKRLVDELYEYSEKYRDKEISISLFTYHTCGIKMRSDFKSVNKRNQIKKMIESFECETRGFIDYKIIHEVFEGKGNNRNFVIFISDAQDEALAYFYEGVEPPLQFALKNNIKYTTISVEQPFLPFFKMAIKTGGEYYYLPHLEEDKLYSSLSQAVDHLFGYETVVSGYSAPVEGEEGNILRFWLEEGVTALKVRLEGELKEEKMLTKVGKGGDKGKSLIGPSGKISQDREIERRAPGDSQRAPVIITYDQRNAPDKLYFAQRTFSKFDKAGRRLDMDESDIPQDPEISGGSGKIIKVAYFHRSAENRTYILPQIYDARVNESDVNLPNNFVLDNRRSINNFIRYKISNSATLKLPCKISYKLSLMRNVSRTHLNEKIKKINTEKTVVIEENKLPDEVKEKIGKAIELKRAGKGKEAADLLCNFVKNYLGYSLSDNARETLDKYKSKYKEKMSIAQYYLTLPYEKRYGDCEIASIVFIALCRHIGLPAREAVGFLEDDKDGKVTTNDGHSWSQVWINGRWQRYDATPSMMDEEEHEGEQLVTVSGKVVDSKGDPVKDAFVEIDGKKVKTDKNGKYSLKVKPGTYTVKVNKSGYKTKQQKVKATSSSNSANFSMSSGGFNLFEILWKLIKGIASIF